MGHDAHGLSLEDCDYLLRLSARFRGHRDPKP